MIIIPSNVGGGLATDPLFSSVSTLLHGEGDNNSTTITDSSSLNASWSTSGSAKISTAQAKFGSASMLFSTSNSYIYPNSSSIFNFGTGDYTIEGWIYMVATTGTYQVVTDIRTGGANFYILIDSGGTLMGFGTTGGNITLSAATWTHFAYCRSGSTVKLFVNGVQSGSNYTEGTSISPTSGSGNRIGYDAGNAFALNAYLDDFRVTKAARYTSNFTVPSAAFPDQ